MCRNDERGRVLVAHRLLDLGNGLDPVFLEVTQDPDEARPKLGPALLEIGPIDDVPSFLAHSSAPRTTRKPDSRKRVKFALAGVSLAPSAIKRIAPAAKVQPDRNRAER